jgi:integrase
MRPSKPRKPFTLYRKQTKGGPVWYVRFWDGKTRRYAVTRSTGVPAEGKRQRRYEAEQAARAMMPSIRFTPACPEKPFIQYLADFWTANSPYARECALVRKRPLSAYYIKMNHDDVRRHMETFSGFRDITLQDLTPGLIRDWVTWLSEKGLSGYRVNHIALAARVAVRYAVSREELNRDPFKNIGEAAETKREKGVLTIAEITRLVRAPVIDLRRRLAVLLGALCGLRRGEIRGLLWADIGNGIITVCHNWIDGEGLKAPKCKGGTVRENTRLVPAPVAVMTLVETLQGIARNPTPDRFIFEGERHWNKPLGCNFFRTAGEKELEKIGIPGRWKGKGVPPEEYVNEQGRRNLTFHGLRHTFITLGRLAGISDLEIQALAGHKSGAMTERYSHAGQVIDFDKVRQKLQKAIGE